MDEDGGPHKYDSIKIGVTMISRDLFLWRLYCFVKVLLA